MLVTEHVHGRYGLNNSRPEARALSSVFDAKGKVREYLRSKESTGLTWHAIACGMWIDWYDHSQSWTQRGTKTNPHFQQVLQEQLHGSGLPKQDDDLRR